MSIDIEELSSPKEIELSELSAKWKCDVLCIQETHRDTNDNRQNINRIQIALELPHIKYGSAILTKHNLVLKLVGSSQVNNIEIITIVLMNFSITSMYKPLAQPDEYINPKNFKRDTSNIVIGDFNSHIVSWSYTETNQDGQKLEA
jgi:exonuclease III